VGIKTNIPLLINILSSDDFVKGNYNTQFLEHFLSQKESRAEVEN